MAAIKHDSETTQNSIRSGDECHILLIDANRTPRLIRIFSDVQCEREFFHVLPAVVPLSVAAPIAKIGTTSFTGYVTTIESSSSFWVQNENDTNLIEAMKARLAKVATSAAVQSTAVHVGELYAAKYACDDLFYRAQVIDKNTETEEGKFRKVFSKSFTVKSLANTKLFYSLVLICSFHHASFRCP